MSTLRTKKVARLEARIEYNSHQNSCPRRWSLHCQHSRHRHHYHHTEINEVLCKTCEL